MGNGNVNIDEVVSIYELTLSDKRPMQNFIRQTTWTGAWKEGVTMLGEAMSSLSKPLNLVAERGFEDSVRNQRP